MDCHGAFIARNELNGDADIRPSQLHRWPPVRPTQTVGTAPELYACAHGGTMPQNAASAGKAKYGRIGDSIPRVEDLRLLTGRGRYTDDVAPSGCSYLVFVRSPYAHAKIGAIDATVALKLPGVAVMTGADLDAAGVKPILNPRDSLGAGYPSFTDDMVIPPWRALAVGKARHVGEAVALVVAPTEACAREAGEAGGGEYKTPE